MPDISLQCLGAAGTVTGSKHLLRTPGLSILVDCGLFQGLKELRQLNWHALPVSASEIDVVLLTHAHLDHCGYLPLLVKNGFKGKIIATAPTKDLAEIILYDSAKIQEEDAERANLLGYSKHKPALPLYNTDDVDNTIPRFEIQSDNTWINLSPHISFRFRKAAHILGACFIEMNCHGKRILFSGDIGRQNSLLLNEPELPERVDFIVVESTYGGRLHPARPAEDDLESVIADTLKKKGNLLIPAFAVGRAQEIIALINKLKLAGRIPDIPVYLDTPMGIDATAILCKYPDWHKLSDAECRDLCENVTQVKKVKQTLQIIHQKKGVKIIIAASGMVTGGRVVHYLKEYLKHTRNTILLSGYQAEGTRGRDLAEGKSEIRIEGKNYLVFAEVRELSSLSAHADQAELISWLSAIKTTPDKVFLVHGEIEALSSFQAKLRETLGWQPVIAKLNEKVTLFEIP